MQQYFDQRPYSLSYSRSSPETEQEHLRLLEEFLTPQRLEQLTEKYGEASIEIQQEIKAAKENWLENKYTAHEERAKPVISKLAKGRLLMLDKENHFIHFCHFLLDINLLEPSHSDLPLM